MVPLSSVTNVRMLLTCRKKSYSACQVFIIPLVLLCMGKYEHQLRASRNLRNGASSCSLCEVNLTIVASCFQGLYKSVQFANISSFILQALSLLQDSLKGDEAVNMSKAQLLLTKSLQSSRELGI